MPDSPLSNLSPRAGAKLLQWGLIQGNESGLAQLSQEVSIRTLGRFYSSSGMNPYCL